MSASTDYRDVTYADDILPASTVRLSPKNGTSVADERPHWGQHVFGKNKSVSESTRQTGAVRHNIEEGLPPPAAPGCPKIDKVIMNS